MTAVGVFFKERKLNQQEVCVVITAGIHLSASLILLLNVRDVVA